MEQSMASKSPKKRARSAPKKASPSKRTTRPPRKGGLDDVPRTTKLAAMIAMLSVPKGATLEQLMTLTGWQQHSIRGAMSGMIKKKLGYTITSKKVGAERVYRIGDR